MALWRLRAHCQVPGASNVLGHVTAAQRNVLLVCNSAHMGRCFLWCQPSRHLVTSGCEAASDACIQQHAWWHLSHERLLAHMHLKPHKVLACIACCLSSRELCMQCARCGCLCRTGCCRRRLTLKPQLCSRSMRRCSSMCLPSVHLHRVLALYASISCWYLQWWCRQTKTYRRKACSSGSLSTIITTQ